MARSSIVEILNLYTRRLSAFRPNARLYLLNVVLSGAAFGVYRLLFNFYLQSLGFDQALMGQLTTTSNMTALLTVLPIGYLADRLGRKQSLLISGFGIALSVIGSALYPAQGVLYAMNVLSGMAQALAGVTMSPFLMENSGEEERTYLFSFASGLQTASAFVGNWLGGNLPSWVGQARAVSETSSTAYSGALLVVAIGALLSLLPLFFLQRQRLSSAERSLFSPFAYAQQHPAMLAKLVGPMLITSIGAGLIMPFMNIFFRDVHAQPDPVIGTMFAWGSLAMGLGLLIAPAIAERTGKIQLVVITQALSIPFLILLGFAPIFWLSAAAYYVRLALMNMSGPVYQAFVMEQVEPESRATVASLTNMAWNFGWAFSPTVSGWLQVRYGFAPAFAGTILMYTISTFLYWYFFWHGAKKALPVQVLVQAD
ncbi:MAG: MFS transporter [Anaerolineales bacterium]